MLLSIPSDLSLFTLTSFLLKVFFKAKGGIFVVKERISQAYLLSDLLVNYATKIFNKPVGYHLSHLLIWACNRLLTSSSLPVKNLENQNVWFEFSKFFYQVSDRIEKNISF